MKKAISSKKRKINDFFISRGWLKFCEKISEGISLVSFPIHKNDDNALAGLPLFIENNYAYSTINEILFGKAAGKLRHLGISFLPSLTCFSPYSDFNVAYAMNKAGSSDLINALIEKMGLIGKEKKARSICFQSISPEERWLSGILKEKGFSEIVTEPVSFLCIREKTFEGYLNSLGSKVKREIKRDYACLNARKIKVSITNSGISDKKLSSLYSNTYEKHMGKRQGLSPLFFRELTSRFGSRIIIAVGRKGKGIAGFCLAIRCGNDLYAYKVGFDYEKSDKSCLYFVFYYELIKWAISHGIKRIWFGTSTYGFKRKLGSSIERRRMYVKFSNHFVNLLMKPYLLIVSAKKIHDLSKELGLDIRKASDLL